MPAAPAAVAAYLTSVSTSLKPGALARRAAAIADRHRRAAHPSPGEDDDVRAVLRAARAAQRSTIAVSAVRQISVSVRPRVRTIVSAAQLARMAMRCPGDLAGLRDQALLLLRAAGIDAARLIALDREHVQLSSHHVELTLPMRGGEASEVVVLARGTSRASCPVRALDSWLHSSDTRFGPVFRKVDRWGNVEHRRMRADALRRIWKRRAAAVRRARSASNSQA
ncbi:MAG: hypothetical protein ACRYHQ_36175 [Janthinobacterium lividum]